jgi:hypothetical protein
MRVDTVLRTPFRDGDGSHQVCALDAFRWERRRAVPDSGDHRESLHFGWVQKVLDVATRCCTRDLGSTIRLVLRCDTSGSKS